MYLQSTIPFVDGNGPILFFNILFNETSSKDYDYKI